MIDNYIGCMVGLAIGDAIGEIKQHNPELNIESIAGRNLNYTDDTALALALADSLLEPGSITTKKIGDAFLKAINNEPNRGYGGSPLIFYAAELNGITYIEARDKVNNAIRNGEGSYGDGAAMRIAPVALFCLDEQKYYNVVKIACEIDHNHELALDSCFVVGDAIHEILESREINQSVLLSKVITRCKSDRMKNALGIIEKALLDNTPVSIVDQILGNNNRSHIDSDSVVSYALYCFLKNMYSFESCLLDSISTNGDADTIAAIACSLSGTMIGFKNIPKKLYSNLENISMIIDTSKDLFYNKECK
jgi:poly(ADP-ribose) glycohydrolase ARH3